MSSALTGKYVLVVGEENSQIKNLESSLKDHGARIKNLACDSVSAEKIEELGIDLILLNNHHDSDLCRDMLCMFRKADFKKDIPIFILIEETAEKIQEALASGAADYVTVNETVQTTIQKMKAIFGYGEDFTSNSAIDITPTEASISSTGIKVFVIEDDPLLRNLLSIRLEKSSFPFEFSKDGKDALPVMRQFKPDIVILDLMLPGKSGFDVLAEIKSDQSLKNVPVIVFSNRDGQDDRSKAKELGAVGFYVKAMTDLSELIEMIESHVKH